MDLGWVGTDLVYELSLRGDGRAESPPLLPAPSQVKAKPREIHRRHQKESISLVDAIGVSFVHILGIDLVGFRLIPTPHRSVLVAVPRAAHDELLPSTAEARHLKPRGNGIGAAFLVCQGSRYEGVPRHLGLQDGILSLGNEETVLRIFPAEIRQAL